MNIYFMNDRFERQRSYLRSRRHNPSYIASVVSPCFQTTSTAHPVGSTIESFNLLLVPVLAPEYESLILS